jgi:hypothetical protein
MDCDDDGTQRDRRQYVIEEVWRELCTSMKDLTNTHGSRAYLVASWLSRLAGKLWSLTGPQDFRSEDLEARPGAGQWALGRRLGAATSGAAAYALMRDGLLKLPWLMALQVSTVDGRSTGGSVLSRLSTVRGCAAWKAPIITCTLSYANIDNVVNASQIHH